MGAGCGRRRGKSNIKEMKKLSCAGRHKVWEVVVFEFISGSGGAVNLERDKWHKTLKSAGGCFCQNVATVAANTKP